MDIKKIGLTAAVLGTLVMSGCGGSSGGGSAGGADKNTPTENLTVNPINVDGAGLVSALNKIGDVTEATAGAQTTVDYKFPALNKTDAGYEMTIPNGALPGHSSRRTIEDGTGAALGYGDVASLKFDMFSWSTGEMVESTNALGGNMDVLLTDEGGIPGYLRESILGRKVGEKMQVVFEANLDELPDYLNQEDGYVLLVELQ